MTSPGGGAPGLPGSGADDTKDISQRLADQMKNPAGAILGQVFARILSVLSGFLNLGDLLSNIARAITGNGVFGGDGPLADIFGFGQQTRVDLGDLQDTTQELLGIIGYAHGYISGGWSTIVGLGKRSVSYAIGRTVGVTRQSGAYYLHSKGLWVADAILNLDQSGVFVVDHAELQVRVYAPDGSLHFVRSAFDNTGMQTTLSVHVPFTVPSAGYYVEYWANVAAARNVATGSRFTGLSVEKRSSEVD